MALLPDLCETASDESADEDYVFHNPLSAPGVVPDVVDVERYTSERGAPLLSAVSRVIGAGFR